MINFIKLTDQYGDEIVVGVDKIVCICDYKVDEKIIGGRLNLSDGHGVFVNETMNEIIDKIKEESKWMR